MFIYAVLSHVTTISTPNDTIVIINLFWPTEQKLVISHLPQIIKAGCIKLQLPVSSNLMRQIGDSVPTAVLTPVSIWFVVVLPDNNIDNFHSEIGVNFGPSMHNTRHDPVQEELV